MLLPAGCLSTPDWPFYEASFKLDGRGRECLFERDPQEAALGIEVELLA